MTTSVVMSYYVCSTKEYNVLCENVGKPKKLRLKRQLTVIYSFVGSSSSIPVLGEIYNIYIYICRGYVMPGVLYRLAGLRAKGKDITQVGMT